MKINIKQIRKELQQAEHVMMLTELKSSISVNINQIRKELQLVMHKSIN